MYMAINTATHLFYRASTTRFDVADSEHCIILTTEDCIKFIVVVHTVLMCGYALASDLLLLMSRHISTLNHLPSADTCLTRTRTVIYWLSVPAITDSASKLRVFGGNFEIFDPESLAARTLSCDRQFFQMSMLPSSDRKQYFISRVNAFVMNHVIVAIQTLWLPAMSEKRTTLSFDQCASCRAHAVEQVRQNANSKYRKQNGHKIAIMAEGNSGGWPHLI